MNVGVLGTAAYARYAGGARGTTAGPGVSLREALRLTDAQAGAFTNLRAALHPRVQALRQRMRQRRQEFFEILATPSPDPTAIDRVLRDMNGIKFEMQRVAADYLLAQKRLLTPEQGAALVRVMASQPGMGEQPRRLPLLGPSGARLPDERR
jgi:Spy/CpxP family protein refolding chaperone